MKICTKCNARNPDDVVRCSQCNAKLPKKTYPDDLVANTTPTKITKNHSCLFVVIRNLIIVIVVLAIIIALIGVIVSCNKEKILSKDKTQVVFDASIYDKISKSELENILGEPSRSENWTNDYGYDMLICDYTQEGQYLSFFIYNDTVVKMYYYPDNPCTYSGNIDQDAAVLFGFESNAEMYANNNITKKYYIESENSTEEIEIYDVDASEHQFGYAHIEFDHQYFS